MPLHHTAFKTVYIWNMYFWCTYNVLKCIIEQASLSNDVHAHTLVICFLYSGNFAEWYHIPQTT